MIHLIEFIDIIALRQTFIFCYNSLCNGNDKSLYAVRNRLHRLHVYQILKPDLFNIGQMLYVDVMLTHSFDIIPLVVLFETIMKSLYPIL